MLRRFSYLPLCAATLALALTGCSKSADQAATNSDSATDSASSGGSGGSSKSRSAREKEPMAARATTPGQSFQATVETPIEIDGKVVIPKGTRATGTVKDAKAAGRFKGASLLELALKRVEIDGKTYDISTSAPTFSHKGKGKRTAVAVGGGAALGALIGGLAGGGKGAAIGAGVGAGAGTGGAAFTGKADVVLPAETALTFKLKAPLELKAR